VGGVRSEGGNLLDIAKRPMRAFLRHSCFQRLVVTTLARRRAWERVTDIGEFLASWDACLASVSALTLPSIFESRAP
jgi:hypothetical protein